jgi:SAM-dependent methyltransferase
MNLAYCTQDSYGVEILPECGEFARALGLNVYTRDVVKDSLADLQKVEAIWCCAVLEHVDAPHVFLRKLATMLSPGGMIFLWIPTIPPLPWRLLKCISFMRPHMVAHTHSDHVNAFTPSTIRFMCERAGFETVEVSAMYPGIFSWLNRWLFVLDGAMYIGRKKEGSAYFGSSTRAGKAEYFDA